MILKRFFILCILISAIWFAPNKCQAQSPADAFSMAKNWYAEENYPQAIIEAKRAVFFSDSLKIPGYLLLSDCNVQMELFDEAIKYLSLAAELEQCDSLQKEILFQKINIYLRTRQPAYALIELSNLKNIESDYFFKKSDFYFALSYFQINDLKLSKKYTRRLLSESSGYDSCYMNALFLKAYKNSNKSFVLPAFSSAILPGSGQLMNGYYREAANTFLLNALLATTTYITFTRLYPLDAILTFYPFIQRYYLSGIFKAKELAMTKQECLKMELYNELLDYIDHLLNDGQIGINPDNEAGI
jgi:hypothetical protein